MSFPPIPHDTLHDVNHELMDVLSLLWAAVEATDSERDDMADASSRTVSLIAMANSKVRDVLRTISPHV